MKDYKVYGQQVIEDRVQMIIEKIKLNRLLGFEKFDINADLKALTQLISKYGIPEKTMLFDMNLMILEDIRQKAESMRKR